MNPVLGMVTDFLWVVASVIFWILYLIDTKREGETQKQQTRRIVAMLICVLVGIFSFISAFAATTPSYPPFPWYSRMNFITMIAFVLFLFTISGKKWATACIIFLVVTFASALIAVFLRTWEIYIPLLKGFF